jgi:hypothetical protein
MLCEICAKHISKKIWEENNHICHECSNQLNINRISKSGCMVINPT